MLRGKVFVVFVVCACLASVLAGPTEPTDKNNDSSSSSVAPTVSCAKDEVLGDCFNNHCVRKYCGQEEEDPNCVFKDECRPDCVCKEGYLWDQNYTCIPAEQCYKAPPCTVNEVSNSCLGSRCEKRYCSEVGRLDGCRDVLTVHCYPGCICKDGYLRTSNGTCVPVDECPREEICAKPREYYDPCPPSCPSRHCYISDEDCALLDDTSCTPSCRCEDGYYMNDEEDCVPKEECYLSSDVSNSEVTKTT